MGSAAHRALLVLAAEVQALVSLELQREALVRALDSRTLSGLAAQTMDEIDEAREALMPALGDASPGLTSILAR